MKFGVKYVFVPVGNCKIFNCKNNQKKRFNTTKKYVETIMSIFCIKLWHFINILTLFLSIFLDFALSEA